MRRPLIIMGTGGNAGDILDAADTLGEAWRIVGFLDDARPKGALHAGLPVLGKLREASGMPADHAFINAIGSDASHRARPDIVASTQLEQERFATLVHAGAFVSPRARLGRGVCVNAAAVIAGDVTIGDHVTVGPGVVIGHDTTVEDYAILAPRAVISGFVHVGRAAYIGAAAAVRQRVRVGEGALVGMGAVVLADVPAMTTVVGNPARSLVRQAMLRTVGETRG